MTEHNVLLYGFIAVSVLFIALCIVTATYIFQTQRRIRFLEERSKDLRSRLRLEYEMRTHFSEDREKHSLTKLLGKENKK